MAERADDVPVRWAFPDTIWDKREDWRETRWLGDIVNEAGTHAVAWTQKDANFWLKALEHIGAHDQIRESGLGRTRVVQRIWLDEGESPC